MTGTTDESKGWADPSIGGRRHVRRPVAGVNVPRARVDWDRTLSQAPPWLREDELRPPARIDWSSAPDGHSRFVHPEDAPPRLDGHAGAQANRRSARDPEDIGFASARAAASGRERIDTKTPTVDEAELLDDDDLDAQLEHERWLRQYNANTNRIAFIVAVIIIGVVAMIGVAILNGGDPGPSSSGSSSTSGWQDDETPGDAVRVELMRQQFERQQELQRQQFERQRDAQQRAREQIAEMTRPGGNGGFVCQSVLCQ